MAGYLFSPPLLGFDKSPVFFPLSVLDTFCQTNSTIILEAFINMITTIASGIILAGIFGLIKSRWLYVITPKLYLNTPLSNRQIVSLTLTNSGFLSEEDVALTFRTACQFELIATSKSTLALNGKTISLPKLSRNESVTILLLFEGKGFEKADIDSFESKNAQGKIVDSKEKVVSLWQHLIAWPIIILFLAVPFSFGTFIGKDTGVSAVQFAEEKLDFLHEAKQLAGFKNQIKEDFSNQVLKSVITDKKITIDVMNIVRRGDVLNITLKIANKTDEILSVTGSIEGVNGTGSLDLSDYRKELAIPSGGAKIFSLKAILSENSDAPLIQGTYYFRTPSGGYASALQTITF